MGNIVTASRWSIDSASQGNKRLIDVKSGSPSSDRDAEVAFNTESQPVGHKIKPGAGKIEFEAYIRAGRPEVDWYALETSGEQFLITQYPVGASYKLQYSGCIVANVTADSNDAGDHMAKVTLVWLRREQMAA